MLGSFEGWRWFRASRRAGSSVVEGVSEAHADAGGMVHLVATDECAGDAGLPLSLSVSVSVSVSINAGERALGRVGARRSVLFGVAVAAAASA